MKHISIRPVRTRDTGLLLALRLQLDRESSFMMYEPGERLTTVSEQEAEISAMHSTSNQTALVAECDGTMVGYVGVYGGAFQRNAHVAYLVAGVLAAYAGQGIGGQLFRAAEEWSRGHGIRRLELTVMTHNVAAIRLYEKSGFTIEGTRRASMRVDDALIDEFYMGKILD